jgi:hypothetical protein
MNKYDFYTADAAEIPHVGVYIADHTDQVVAMFLIGTLKVEQAEELAMRTIKYLEGNGAAK